MKKALQFYCATLIIRLLSFLVATIADDRVNFIDMDQLTYLKPWQSYQKLVGLQLAAKSYDDLTHQQ
jgi:hypothetical protein